jgi:hypothetical protein
VTAKPKTMSSMIDISAEPAAIFNILANPHRHPEIDGSGTLGADVEGPDRLAMGSKFRMRVNQGKVHYPTPNKVIEFEENRLIAWKHFGPQIWRYQLDSIGNGQTRVTETFDYSRYGPFAPLIRRQFAGNQQSMDKTLLTLKKVAEKG